MAKTINKTAPKKTDDKPMPNFEPGSAVVGVSVISDLRGDLYQIDANHGTIRKLKWTT